MNTDDLGAIDTVGILTDPVRRALYQFVVAQPEPVGREEAAEGAGVSRSLAAFHLDRLVTAGLLAVSFRRLTGRSGPGAGRPAKLYTRSAGEHSVSLPPRRYDLAAELLADGVEASKAARNAFAAAALERGRAIGATARRTRNPLADASAAVAALGYEPRIEGRSVVLANCPFHALAEQHVALVCGGNVALLAGVAEGLGGAVDVALQPAPGRCCVILKSKTKRR